MHPRRRRCVHNVFDLVPNKVAQGSLEVAKDFGCQLESRNQPLIFFADGRAGVFPLARCNM